MILLQLFHYISWLPFVIFLLTGDLVAAVNNALQRPLFHITPPFVAIIILTIIALVEPQLLEPPRKKRRLGKSTRATKRRRREVNEIMDEFGETYVRRSYRMTRETFWKLHDILWPLLRSPPNRSNKKSGATNGIITTSVRLSIAIRFFAGGDPKDIMGVHGVSHSVVFESVWRVVDAVNRCNALHYQFPEDYDEQYKLARGFEAKSKAGFNNCVGTIDGILIWIQQPDKNEYTFDQILPGKYFSYNKKKYGLNMQAVCDAECRFLEVAIDHPGATSDFLAFMRSEFNTLLETPGYLAPGLCLFGDNAYVNKPYMATPYAGKQAGSKDAYNFFHSQVRITIERCFGQFVHRWGILRAPMSTGITISKITSLVTCLARLHNFCINHRENIPPALIPEDLEYIARQGGGMRNSIVNVTRLTDAGNHFLDDPLRTIRRTQDEEVNLPRERLHAQVVENNYVALNTIEIEIEIDVINILC
jgi:hypothetical protein